MNRPFYAFGALLIALALAMLAVSSTRRSTSVSSAPVTVAQAERSSHAETRPSRAARFCGVIVVLPAVEEETSVADRSVLEQVPLYCTGCDWDRSMANLPDWDCRDVCPLAAYYSEPPAAPAVTLATHDPALLRDETSRDCRAHYDPVYDVLVYGEIDSPICASGPSITVNRRKPQADFAAAAPVEWSDYSVLIDEALSTGATSGASAESTNSVRSSRVLLDFAASALSRTGLLFQSAAEELRRAARPGADAQLAGESPPSQR